MSSAFRVVVVPDLCTDLINRTLGLEMEPGPARLSSKIHQKIATKHAADYPVCMANLQDCLQDPTFIGEDPKHPDKVELIRRVGPATKPVLVSICIERDDRGAYGIASAYCISEEKLQRWRQSGQVRVTVRPPPA